MSDNKHQSSGEPAERSAELAYLESRTREEADAAATATSIEATLVHVVLATAYAKRLQSFSSNRPPLAPELWVQEHRVW